MTDVQREEEDRRLGSDALDKKQKVAYNYMQRYYHKGAFNPANIDTSGYTEADMQVINRDYNMPTGEDKMDKSVLPQVLQKRTGQFGRKGNTKYTHLTD